MKKEKKYFTDQLMNWNRHLNKREMPWKAEKDPYKIWLSEIILQQTRVEQGWDYYNRFIATFPTVQQLAKTPETKVFKLWEGLGYYSRCKNLIASAKIIAGTYKGKFPDTYENILALKGVGPYTAAAIASFAFDLPYAVVDGNVFRVLSRYFGIDTPTDSTIGKKLFTALADELLYKASPGSYNQALMDFGATVCKPMAPACGTCPLKTHCAALKQNKVSLLPVKEKTILQKKRWISFLMVAFDGKIYARKRGAGDIWENLYEFIPYETTEPVVAEMLASPALVKKQTGTSRFTVLNISPVLKQQLTHQTIQGHIVHLELNSPPKLPGYQAFSPTQLARLPFPKFIAAYLQAKENGPKMKKKVKS